MCHATFLQPQQGVKDVTRSIAQLGRRGRWDDVLAAWKSCRCNHLETDVMVCNAAVAGCRSAWHAAQILVEAKGSSLEADAVTLTSLLRSWRGGDWEKACAALAQASSSSIPPDAVLFAGILAACSAAGRWGEAFQVLSDLEDVCDQLHRNSAAAACDTAKRWDLAVTLLELGRQRRSQVDAVGLNSAISACAGGPWERAMMILHSFAQFGFLPDLISINTALSAVPGELILGLLRQLRRHQLRPDVHTFSSLMVAYVKSAKWHQALKLLQRMPRRRIRSNAYTFSSVASACKDHWKLALGVLSDSKARALPEAEALLVSVISACEGGGWRAAVQMAVWPLALNAAVTAAGGSGHWQEALQILEASFLVALRADAARCNGAIGSCSRCSKWEEALRLFKRMAEVGPEPNAVSQISALMACGRGDHWQGAVLLLSEAEAPQALAFFTACSACAAQGQWRWAVEVVAKMIRAGSTAISAETINAAVSACEKGGGRWEQALALLSQFGRARLPISSVALNAALSACEKARQWQRALRLLFLLDGHGGEGFLGVQATAVSFNAAASACGRARRWQRAAGLLTQMSETGTRPDSYTFNALASSFDRASLWEQALGALRRARVGEQASTVGFSAAISACSSAKGWAQAYAALRVVLVELPADVISFSAALTSATWNQALVLFAEMTLASLQLELIPCSAGISACERAGQWAAALGLLSEMWLRSAEPSVTSVNAALAACAFAALQLLRKEQVDGILLWASSSLCPSGPWKVT
ncbi:unnamed protein product [Effrenium voratum]|uniref:Pentatricopeptide repeat-containing protein, chloroplastic n=1 Tax=Effrenium voratum TaxID=2562239 RepID=A0AA36JJF8_9DINO|nr:unnamed protein product [Effrenium voratum]